MAPDDLEFHAVTKRYGDVTAVSKIDLAVQKGAFLAILGPSGCGKTTCLRMIGGFEQPTEGTVRIGGDIVNGVPAHRRPVNMVFQHYGLFPHLDVAENVAYGLKQRRPRIPGAEIRQRVDRALDMVRLSGFGPRRVHEMSGGQQQRVALARAIVNRPRILLLDEPLAALDRKLRSEMQIELLTLQRDLGITFILVTHDQEEALSMADLVCVMSAGSIRQIGSPQAVYDRPADLFVADFVGKINRMDGVAEDGALRLVDGTALPLPEGAVSGRATGALRPEAIRLTRAGGAGTGLRGTVTHRIFLGSVAEYAVEVPSLGPFLATADRRGRNAAALVEPGEAVTSDFDPSSLKIFPADT